LKLAPFLLTKTIQRETCSFLNTTNLETSSIRILYVNAAMTSQQRYISTGPLFYDDMRPGKNLPAVSHLPDVTGNGKIPKTAGLPDLPVGKPIQI